MTKKAITIITPTYNRSKTLRRLYNSLLNQSFKSFKWLIMDDGSNDGTAELVYELINENLLDIEYHFHENVHKVITMHRGFKHIKTPFFMRVDSDDYLSSESLNILYTNMLKIENNDSISSVIGRVEYSNSKKIGDEFPTDPFVDYVFLMKYKYKIGGVHAGLFKTKILKLSTFDESKYLGKGYLPDFWNIEIDSQLKTYFINDIVYTYDLNEEDPSSITNTKFNIKYAYGLSELYRTFLKYYFPKYFFSYPVAILKNMFKYIYYSSFLVNKFNYKSLVKLDGILPKIIFILMTPSVYLYKLFSKDLKKI